MGTALANAIGAMLDNFADVIEGGDSWSGVATPYLGIPGRRSNDRQIDATTWTATASCTATNNGAADGTTVIDTVNASGAADTYNNQYWVHITSGACVGEWARIVDDDGAGTLTLEGVGFSAQILAAVTFDIIATPAKDSPLSVAAGVSTTVFSVASAYSWEQSRWVKENTPGYWMHCTTSTGAGAPNLNCARKISAWDNSTKRFTVAAFPQTPTATDVMEVLQGFKRFPNGMEIDADHSLVDGGFDRFFSLSALPGKQMGYFGKGMATYETELHLKLRMSKSFRQHDSIAAAFENLAIIRSLITRSANPDHRDTTYAVALLADGGGTEIVKDDKYKTVAMDKYRLIYKVNTEFC
jgi:hypothetical protein